MKFNIEKETLLKPLVKLNGIVNKKTVQPILSHLLLEVSEQGITMKGTDTEVTLQIHLPASEQLTIEETGGITVPVFKLLDVVRHLPAKANIAIKLDNQQLIIHSASSVFRLATLPAEDFPALSEEDANTRIEINGKLLHNIIYKVQCSMAKDDARYYLNGLFLNVSEEGAALDAVSTDGHRLSYAQCSLEEMATAETSLILPKKGVEEILKLLADLDQPIVLNLGERQLKIQIDQYIFTTQLIDGNYPKYHDILPPLQEKPIKLNRKDFLEALQRAKVLLTEKHNGLRLRFSGKELFLSARNQENETVEAILTTVDVVEKEVESSLNTSYLIEAVNLLESEQIELHYCEEKNMFLLTNENNTDARYIIMPMRL